MLRCVASDIVEQITCMSMAFEFLRKIIFMRKIQRDYQYGRLICHVFPEILVNECLVDLHS